MIALRRASIGLGGRTVLRDVDSPPALVSWSRCAGRTAPARPRCCVPSPAAGRPARPDPRRVAYLPQGARCAWGLTVREVAALGRIPHRDAAVAPVTSALTACGILPLSEARIDRISGGEARRAMLARAFATEPEVFLLDEPTADLDPAAAHAILRLLRATADAGRTIVVVLHAVEMAIAYAHRVVVVQAGRIAADLPADQALPAAASAFGLRVGVDLSPRLLPPA